MLNRWYSSLSRSAGLIPPYVILALTLSLTGLLTAFVYYRSQQDAEQLFTRLASQTVNAIESRMHAYTDTLLHTRGLFMASEFGVDREEFEEFVSSLDLGTRYPGIQGIGFTRRLKLGEIPLLEKQMRAQGFPDFHVWPMALQNESPSSSREDYFTVLYLEPLDWRNKRAIGYDMFTEPNRREAMVRARDTGLPATTRRVVLVQETPDKPQFGFLIYVPVYNRPMAQLKTVEQRRAALTGFVYSPFRSEDLFARVTQELNTEERRLDVEVFDGTKPSSSSLFFDSHIDPSDSVEVPSSRFTESKQLEIGGTPWLVRVDALPGFTGSAGIYAAWAILAIGLLVSGIAYRWSIAYSRYNFALSEKARQLRSVTDAMPALVSFVGRDRRYQFINAAYEDWFGWTRAEVEGHCISEFMNGPAQRFLPEVARALEGEHVALECSLAHRTKGVRRVKVDLIPERDDSHSIVGFTLVGIDITELKLFAEQLKTLAEQRSFMAEASQALSSSLDYRVTLSRLVELQAQQNGLICSITIVGGGGPPEHFTSHSTANGESAPPLNLDSKDGPLCVIRKGDPQFVADLSDPDASTDNVSPDWLRSLRECGIKSYVCTPIRIRGRNIGALTLMTGSRNGSRAFDRSDVSLARELADRAATSIENSRLYDEAQKVNRIKDEFLATLSHELRTPLNVIQGHAEILMTEAPKGELTESIEAIYRNAKVQTQIVDDLLDVSSIITGKLSFRPELVDLAEVVEAGLDSVRFTASAKQIQIQSHIGKGPFPVVGDPTRLQQVLWNLLSNAIKFTPEQGRIDLSLKRENGSPVGQEQVAILVKDSGRGIDRAFLPYIFDRFRQEDNSTTRRYGGLGLGLAIVRSLVELHGGSVAASSAGRELGSEFKVTLPLATQVQRLSSRKVEGKPVQPSSGGPGYGLHPNARILVIDDEEETRHLLTRQLERAGMEVVAVGSADEGFGIYQRFDPDLIISDIAMPGEDGLSFMKRIRAVEGGHKSFTPAVALTAFARDDDRQKVFSAGFQVHLTKPVESKLLLRTVRDVLEQYS